MKKLSFNMLRGLFADIINDAAKSNLYCFNKYKILVIDDCEEKDIKKLERFMMDKKDGKRAYRQIRQNQTNKRHKKVYAKRRKNEQCVRCGKKEDEMLQ